MRRINWCKVDKFSFVNLCRRDKYHCYVTIEFSARGVNESAVTLIACPQKDENSTLGSSIDICYTHNNPSEGPLLTGPKAFIPLERYFIAASPKCANTSYAKALHCKKTLNPVKWTLLGQFLFPIAFVVIASLFMGLVHLFGLCQACIQSIRKKRAVIPDTNLEMAREQA